MPFALPSLRVGNPLRNQALSLFPLFSGTATEVDYRLSDEAIADQSIFIEEVSESGSVPELMVENKSEKRVLFLEGEELIGAKTKPCVEHLSSNRSTCKNQDSSILC